MYYTDIGYDDYDQYLAGPEWWEIKDFFYHNCGRYRCRVCSANNGLVLHKRSYEHLTMKSLRERYVFTFLIIRYLKKYMVYLCREHNHMIHFYDNGAKVPLEYYFLWRREQLIYEEYNTLWRRIKRVKPSDLFRYIFRLFNN